MSNRAVTTAVWDSRKYNHLVGVVVSYTLLALISAIFLVPFLWMVSMALKSPADLYDWPPKWIPNPVVWGNFAAGLTRLPFGRYFLNTTVITLTNVVGRTLSASMVAYGVARLRAPGRNVLFLIVLSTMMLPAQVTMIPVYVLFSKLGWVNTFKPLIVPGFLGGGPYSIFLLRQFFMTISTDLDDSAKIDGCGYIGIYWRLIMPLGKAALAIVAILAFMRHWNDFMGPLIYLNDMDRYTVALALRFFRTYYSIDYNELMAVSILAILPCLILFFFAQKYFIQGIVFTGLKG